MEHHIPAVGSRKVDLPETCETICEFSHEDVLVVDEHSSQVVTTFTTRLGKTSDSPDEIWELSHYRTEIGFYIFSPVILHTGQQLLDMNQSVTHDSWN